MCGIGAILKQVPVDGVVTNTNNTSISDADINFSLSVEELISVLTPRGPDQCGVAQVQFNSDGSISTSESATEEVNPSLTLVGCVLSMRGEGGLISSVILILFAVTKQPIQDKQGNILLWNGEIFDSQNKQLQIQHNENDGRVLFEVLGNVEDDISIPCLLQDIKGPWAIMYWQVCDTHSPPPAQ